MITKEISPVAYQLALPANWRIQPPDLIEGEEEFEVERIVAHWEFG